MKHTDKSQKKRKNPIKWVLLTIGILSLAVVLFGAGFITYVTLSTDVEADMTVMEMMRSSRTTRLYVPGGDVPRESLTLDNYMPVEADILFGSENMVWAQSDEIPDLLKNAFVAIEDAGFYEHSGVEWGRTIYAGLNQIFHFRPRFGGSTITQQLVKNVHGDSDISVLRKAREIVRALRLEKEYSKDEILTYYLNIVPLGHNCVGVKSAARYYFNCEPDELKAEECAALAAITNAPARYDPVANEESQTARRRLVLNAMYAHGYLPKDVYETAYDTALILDITDPIYTVHPHNWYTETVVLDIIRDLKEQLGISEGVATTMLYRGGLEIYTLMDPKIQSIMEAYFSDESHFTGLDDQVHQAGMTVMDPMSGDLLGVVGGVGAKEGSRLFNRATEGYYPPGSALKPPALYGPGIEWNDIHYATAFDDVPMPSGDGYWPHNSPNIYMGRVTAHEALAKSKNTVAVQLLEKLGEKRVFDHLKNRLGMSGLVEGGAVSDIAVAPLALGQLSYGTTVRELTGIYAGFASGGIQSNNRSYLAVFDAKGKPILKNENTHRRVWSEQTAYLMTRMMQEVVDSGTAKRLTLKEVVDTAGKTGTSGANLDKWFVGYTPCYVAGIHCAHDDRTPMMAADKTHLTAWDTIMQQIHSTCRNAGADMPGFHMPDGIVEAEYCLDSGCVPTDACRDELRGDRTAIGHFKAEYVPYETCNMHVNGHFSFREQAYDDGEGVPGESVDFYVLTLPERIIPQDSYVQDAPYTLEYLKGMLFETPEAPPENENTESEDPAEKNLP